MPDVRSPGFSRCALALSSALKKSITVVFAGVEPPDGGTLSHLGALTMSHLRS
jgi:hypothetical protein